VAKHVVILVENLPVPFDRRPWQIAQTLLANGYRVSVICPSMYEYTKRYEKLAGIEIHRYPSREGSTPIGWIAEYINAVCWMFLICMRLFFTVGIDAIHACNPPDLLWVVAWPFKIFAGVRFLFDHHDLNPEVYLAKFNRHDKLYFAMLLLERMTYRLADIALATNESFRRIAVARDGIRPDRVYIVRNAPMPGRFTSGPAIDQLRNGKEHLIVYLGIMNKQDGLDLLLESIRCLVRDLGRSDVFVALIGDGTELPQLQQLAHQLGLDDCVRFVGRVADGRVLSDYLNTASVCVCPDPKNEMNDHSTMTKIVEYLSLGRPVVAYDLQESIYSAGDAALYATGNNPRLFAELIVRLLDDRATRHSMGERGKARYDRMLSWQRSQEQLLAAYDRLFPKERP
jgi:glycosyltransferase involved in cell wall biosynthesis